MAVVFYYLDFLGQTTFEQQNYAVYIGVQVGRFGINIVDVAEVLQTGCQLAQTFGSGFDAGNSSEEIVLQKVIVYLFLELCYFRRGFGTVRVVN